MKRFRVVLLVSFCLLFLSGCDSFPLFGEKNAVKVPILMYHHISDTFQSSVTVTPEQFAAHMDALSNAGYHTVSFRNLVDFVDNGTPLPDNPLVITFDDGYSSVTEIAAPILAQHGFCASAAVIGKSIGDNSPVLPQFSLSDAKPWIQKGVLEVGAHSWDFHHTEPRLGIYRMKGETIAQYQKALQEDTQKITDTLTNALGEALFYAYPYGYYNMQTENVLKQAGYRVTLTVDSGINTIYEGKQQSLYCLKRLNVPDTMDAAGLLEMLKDVQG